MLDHDTFELRTVYVRKQLLQVIQSDIFDIPAREDAAAELIRIIRVGGGPAQSAEYRQQLLRLEKILKQMRPRDGADIPIPAILPLLAEIAELLSKEVDDGPET